MNYKQLALLLLSMAINQWVGAQVFEETRTLTRTFKTTLPTTVEINNKYGAVVVSTWDKDSVKIEVTRRISEKSEERFKKIRDNIDFSFVSVPNRITAETIFGDKHATLIQNVKEVTNFMSASDARSRIDYRVTVPARVNLKVTNKYGDVVLPNLLGNVTLDLSNGNLQARDIEGQAGLTLAFGSASLKRLSQCRVSVNFVDFSCDYASNMVLDARSSKVVVADVHDLQFSSRRDQVRVGRAEAIKGEAYFSKLDLASVAETADLKMTYGELTSLGLGKQFKKCLLLSQMCDVNLELETPLPYSMLLMAAKATPVLPPDLKPASADYAKSMAVAPVKFAFGKPLGDDKLKINISEAVLKIEHR